MKDSYRRWMHDWETRMTSRDNNRVVRPFEWGAEFVSRWPVVSEMEPPQSQDGDRSMLGRRERRPDRHGRQEFRDVRAREDGFHAVHGFRGAGIDRPDAAVCHVAALERHMLHADERHIVDIRASASNEARVLASLGPLANELRQHR